MYWKHHHQLDIAIVTANWHETDTHGEITLYWKHHHQLDIAIVTANWHETDTHGEITLYWKHHHQLDIAIVTANWHETSTHGEITLYWKHHHQLDIAIVTANWHETNGIVVDGEFSSWKSVLSEVPHGSVLGPSLFLICIKYLGVTSKILNFAHDTVNIVFVFTKKAKESIDKHTIRSRSPTLNRDRGRHNLPSVYNTIVQSRDTRMTTAVSRDQNQSWWKLVDANRKLLTWESNFTLWVIGLNTIFMINTQ